VGQPGQTNSPQGCLLRVPGVPRWSSPIALGATSASSAVACPVVTRSAAASVTSTGEALGEAADWEASARASMGDISAVSAGGWNKHPVPEGN